MADVLLALDRGDIAFLTLLDRSAAFDTVDHATLLKRMEISYGLKGTLLSWFRSYFTGRKQSVQFNNARSLPTLVLFGVPQGSVLGPILFLLYTADLLRLVEQFHLYFHLYADDTQIYGFSAPSAALELQNRVSVCVAEVSLWMCSTNLIQPRRRSVGSLRAVY